MKQKPRKSRGVLGRAIHAIEALEPRRMLAFVVQGTSGDDLIEMRVSDVGNRVHEFRVNGQVVGTTQQAEIQIFGLAGNDTFSLASGLPDTIQGFPFQLDVFGGPGDDVYLPSLAMTTRLHESPGEGSDSLISDETSFPANAPQPIARQLRTQVNSIFENILFDNDLENIEVRYGEFELNLTVKGPIPAGLKLVLGNKKNVVKFEGNDKRIDQDLLPGQVIGGSSEDTVIFDDSAGNATVNRDYTVTPTAFMNQSFTGVEKAEIKTRLNTTATANTVFMTGAGRVTGSVTFSNAESTGALTPTRLSIGTQAAPIDLDSLALEVNAKFISHPQLRYEIFDQDANHSGNAFTIDADANRQIVRKGQFVAKFDNTQAPGGAGISLLINGGSTADVFEVKDVLPLSRVTINGGGGDDKLLTISDAAHGNAPEQVFLGTSFVFDGGMGNDIVDLDDRSAAFPGGVDEYQISTGFTKNGKLWMTHRNVDRVNFLAGGQTNIIRIDTRGTSDNALDKIYFIDAGSGNDTITNFVPGQGGGSLGANVTLALVGGIGNDTLIIDDSLAESPTDQYTLNNTAFSYSGSGAGGTFSFSSVENVILVQNGRSTTTQLRRKQAGTTLDVAAGAGNDTIIVGGGDLDSNGWFTSPVTLSGGTGTDHIIFDDEDDSDAAGETESYTLGNLSIAKGPTPLIYSSFEHQTLLVANGLIAGQFNTVPAVNINSISGFLDSTTIVGGAARQCTVNVGNGNLSNIAGIVNINLNGGFLDRVTVNDQLNSFGSTSSFEINDSQVRKTSSNQTINYSGVTQLTLNTRDSTTVFDAIAVRSTPAGLSLFVNANAGSDSITLGKGDIDADLLGPVTINGGTGTNRLTINNSLDAAPATQTLTNLTFIDGLTHNYSSIQNLIVNQGPGGTNLSVNSISIPTTINGGSGDDVVNIGAGSLAGALGANITVNGGPGNDSLSLLGQNDSGTNTYAFPSFNQFRFGDLSTGKFVTFSAFEQATLRSGTGGDTIDVTTASIPLSIFSGTGNDAVTVSASTAPVTVDTGPEQTVPFGFRQGDVLSVGFVSTFPASVVVAQNDTVIGLSVVGASTLRIANGAVIKRGPPQFIDFGLNLTGTIDLGDGALLWQSGGTAPDFRPFLTTGHNGGAWNGTSANGAINSSLAAGSASSDGVGYGLGSELGITNIGGFSIAPGDTLIRYTLNGDANLDGQVNLADFNRLAGSFGQSNKQWVDGDSNYDGLVNLSDFNALAGNFGASLAQNALFSANRIQGLRDSDFDDLIASTI